MQYRGFGRSSCQRPFWYLLNFNNCARSSCYSLSVTAFMCEQFTLRVLWPEKSDIVCSSVNCLGTWGVQACMCFSLQWYASLYNICDCIRHSLLAKVFFSSFSSYQLYVTPLVSNWSKSTNPIICHNIQHPESCIMVIAALQLWYHCNCSCSWWSPLCSATHHLPTAPQAPGVVNTDVSVHYDNECASVWPGKAL